jgi:hypothetical protein
MTGSRWQMLNNSGQKERHNMLQNDANTARLNLRGSAGNLNNTLVAGRGILKAGDFEFTDARRDAEKYPLLRQAVEDIQSQGSLLSQSSQHSSKYAVEALEDEVEDDDKVKS